MIEWLKNLFRQKWWHKDEWVQVDKEVAIRVLEKHDCPSWDLEHLYVYTYKNKDSCEVRKRACGELTFMETTFEDPDDMDRPLVSEMDIYEGGKYD